MRDPRRSATGRPSTMPPIAHRCGITIGTAITISGAAASPSMGMYSTPALTFLMTLLNARLGAWLGNPGPRRTGHVVVQRTRRAARCCSSTSCSAGRPIAVRTSICRTAVTSTTWASWRWSAAAAASSSSSMRGGSGVRVRRPRQRGPPDPHRPRRPRRARRDRHQRRAPGKWESPLPDRHDSLRSGRRRKRGRDARLSEAGAVGRRAGGRPELRGRASDVSARVHAAPVVQRSAVRELSDARRAHGGIDRRRRWRAARADAARAAELCAAAIAYRQGLKRIARRSLR